MSRLHELHRDNVSVFKHPTSQRAPVFRKRIQSDKVYSDTWLENEDRF